MTTPKRLQLRSKQAQQLSSSIKTHKTQVAKDIVQRLSSQLKQGERLDEKSVELLLTCIQRTLDSKINKLESDELNLARERGEDSVTTENLESEISALYREMLDFKELLRDTYTISIFSHIGITGTTPKTSLELIQQARRLRDWLADSKNAFPAPDNKYKPPVSRKLFLANLNKELAAVEPLLEKYSREQMETKAVHIKTMKEYADFDEMYKISILLTEQSFKLAGLEEESKGLRYRVPQKKTVRNIEGEQTSLSSQE
jgi:hypothetical protein